MLILKNGKQQMNMPIMIKWGYYKRLNIEIMHKQILPIFSMGIFCNRIKNNTLIVDLKKEKKKLYLTWVRWIISTCKIGD